MSLMVMACVVGFIGNVVSFTALLTYDYKIIKILEIQNSLEWMMTFSSLFFLILAWWRFQAQILVFRNSMSVEVKVKYRPQHRWEHHVRTKILPAPKLSMDKKKVNKISTAKPTKQIVKIAPAKRRSNSKHTSRNRGVTKVVPTRYGKIVRVNIAENDGHQLSDSWCFSTTTIHQLSVFSEKIELVVLCPVLFANIVCNIHSNYSFSFSCSGCSFR